MSTEHKANVVMLCVTPHHDPASISDIVKPTGAALCRYTLLGGSAACRNRQEEYQPLNEP